MNVPLRLSVQEDEVASLTAGLMVRSSHVDTRSVTDRIIRLFNVSSRPRKTGCTDLSSIRLTQNVWNMKS